MNSGRDWINVGGIRTSKSKKKNEGISSKKNKENFVVKTRSNKKKDIPSTPLGIGNKKGEMKNIKARECCPHVTPLGKGFKVGDFCVYPSSASRLYNIQRRMVEINRSIANDSQTTILETKKFHNK